MSDDTITQLLNSDLETEVIDGLQFALLNEIKKHAETFAELGGLNRDKLTDEQVSKLFDAHNKINSLISTYELYYDDVDYGV